MIQHSVGSKLGLGRLIWREKVAIISLLTSGHRRPAFTAVGDGDYTEFNSGSYLSVRKGEGGWEHFEVHKAQLMIFCAR